MVPIDLYANHYPIIDSENDHASDLVGLAKTQSYPAVNNNQSKTEAWV
jgi:hypothetical protein